ncbi:MAG: DUF4412 domain-containing protein [Thermoanaerobaculaceae bacterium]|mgnify:CR=1 FL=1|nr:DUF4412 domain-containing protein [Thermoanaerobaculaceae bacterium]MDI9623040.1 DUF4412 domain-containing protein [Acidobacteriota bacterium]NLH10465.1 DUF4412 domain-containing protein [Holophagae bacterium]HPW56789.1 DUF4412 domain-containing protein [Thermoanaerobaculaceae bacterium]
MSKRVVVVVLAVLVLAPAAWGGVVFTSVTKVEGGKVAEQRSNTVNGWVDGDLARFEFTQSGNPMMAEGTYLITTDGGKEVFLVNPKGKSFSRFDVEGMMQFATSAMKVVNMKFSDPRIEKLGQAPNGLVAGVPTIHYQYRTSYTVSMGFMGMKKSTRIVTEEEIWSAPKLLEAALGIWLRKSPPKLGDDNLDNLLRAEMEKIEGFPLKRKIVRTSTDEKGNVEVTTTLMEVTSLEMTSVSASLFEIPPDYKEITPSPDAEDDKEGENPFLKMLGGKKK